MRCTRIKVLSFVLGICVSAGWAAPETVQLKSWKFIKEDAAVNAAITDWENPAV